MAKSPTNRSEARNEATGTTTSTPSTGQRRRPGNPSAAAEDAGQVADAVEQGGQAEAKVENRSLIVIAPNPKRKGTKAHSFYAKYPPHLTMSTIDAARYDKEGKELVRGKDLSWDFQRRHILLGEEASNFPVDGTKEEQVAYLRSLPATDAVEKISDKQLIAWGFMEAPKEVVEEAKAEVAKEDAKATA